MDPITLATVTSAVTVVASEAAKGAAGAAGKDLWARIKGRLGLQHDPSPGELAPAVAQRLVDDGDAMRDVLKLLSTNAAASPTAAALVGQIHAERLVIMNEQTIHGDFTLNM